MQTWEKQFNCVAMAVEFAEEGVSKEIFAPSL